MKRFLLLGALACSAPLPSFAQPPAVVPGMAPALPPVRMATPEEVEEAIGGSTRVTLVLDNVDSKTAFAQFAKASNTSIKVNGDIPQQTVSMEFENTPFWVAFDRLLTQTKTRMSITPHGNSFTVFASPAAGRFGVDDASAKYPTIQSGPFEVRARAVTRTLRATLDANTDTKLGDNAASVEIGVRLDPKLERSFSVPMLRVQAAEDDAGKSILTGNRQLRLPAAFFNNPSLVADLNLQPNSKRIAFVRGTYETTLILKREAWEIAAPLETKDITRRVGNYELSFDGLTKAGDEYVMRYRSTRAQANIDRNDNTQDFAIGNGIVLEDAAGRRYQQTNFSIDNKENTATGTISFKATTGPVLVEGPGPVGEPAKLTWTLPSDTRRVSVPWEFKDLPLP
ncbi:MAG TPA: hypothetical protein VF681_07170 [Abditibacteriaceae bacterium]|jgi:hypothetical protein